MTEKQIEALKKLKLALFEVGNCCEDDNFNSLVGELEIFGKDIFEAISDIDNILDL